MPSDSAQACHKNTSGMYAHSSQLGFYAAGRRAGKCAPPDSGIIGAGAFDTDFFSSNMAHLLASPSFSSHASRGSFPGFLRRSRRG